MIKNFKNCKTIFSLNDEFRRIITFDVTVEEALTGRSQNTSANVMFHNHKYKMDLIRTSEYFKPGLKYTAFVSCILRRCPRLKMCGFIIHVFNFR